MQQRQIFADYDELGIHVYQAFEPRIVDAALARGTFAAGFNLERITWIKPSLGWMLHRSKFATAVRQERILKIKLPHDFFLQVLSSAVLTSFEPEAFASQEAWRSALRASPVRCQWDPDRDWRDNKLDRRAIQLGLAGSLVRDYVAAVMELKDVTPQAHQYLQLRNAGSRETPADYPQERVYAISPELRERLGMKGDLAN